MNGQYTLSFIETSSRRKISHSGYSLPNLDKATTGFNDEASFIAVFQDKLLGLNPDKLAISYRNIMGNADIEVVPCYSDNEMLKSMLTSVSKNDDGKDIVDSKNLSFMKTVRSFIDYCSLSKAFRSYARSFLVIDEELIIDYIEGVINGIYNRDLLIRMLQKYENVRNLTIILMQALKDPEVVMSIVNGYNEQINKEKQFLGNIGRNSNMYIDDAIAGREKELEMAEEKLTVFEMKQAKQLLNFISDRNSFMEECKEVLKKCSDFQK